MTENRASKASAKYDAENTKRIYIKLNKGTDADIIGWLSLKRNTQGFIKEMIRGDMEMNKKEYNVVIIGSTKNQDIETEQLVTNDIKKAIKEARDLRDVYHSNVEIRVYADPDREENGNWDYDLVEF